MADNDRTLLPSLFVHSSIRRAALPLAVLLVSKVSQAGDGFVPRGDERRFAIGFYEMPNDDGQLKDMAEAGVNLVRCHHREDLDRVHAVGMMGVVPLGLQQGATESLRKQVDCDWFASIWTISMTWSARPAWFTNACATCFSTSFPCLQALPRLH